ncbi:hypothetical protein UFOVP3_64 [uncultured Caudovirales phage]|uniref:Uncharacterized protein n=1 Tax=uncultured Caudovirales phage TaxID=2100421 RepID=A0A6J5T9V1_9CAUD|nr:hypothetical protein UFOVP3_64 [uncultured Caudovirales phage]
MLNYAIKLVLLTFLVVIWLNPKLVGVWEAKKDVAYEAYMGEHYDDN